MDQDGLDQAITFVWATWRFWWLRGHTAELARVREKFMAMRREMAPHERALVLSGTGFTFMRDGDLDKAQPAFEQSLPLFSEAGDPLGGAEAAAGLGHVLASQHDDKRAGESLAAIARQQDDPPRAPHDHSIEAELRSRMGDAAYERPPRAAGPSRAHARYRTGWMMHHKTHNGRKTLRKAAVGAVS